jgi:hypothetical protein
MSSSQLSNAEPLLEAERVDAPQQWMPSKDKTAALSKPSSMFFMAPVNEYWVRAGSRGVLTKAASSSAEAAMMLACTLLAIVVALVVTFLYVIIRALSSRVVAETIAATSCRAWVREVGGASLVEVGGASKIPRPRVPTPTARVTGMIGTARVADSGLGGTVP